MRGQKTVSRGPHGPYSKIGRGTTNLGKCHLIAHTRNQDEERPICLACPYDRCLLEPGGAPKVAADFRRSPRGRRPDPRVAARNIAVLEMLAGGHHAREVAERFGISIAHVYKIRFRAGAAPLRPRRRIELPAEPVGRRIGPRPGRAPDPLVRARNAHIIELRNAGATGRELAARFNLDRHTIYNIITYARRESQ